MAKKEFIELTFRSILSLTEIDQSILLRFVSKLNPIEKIMFKLKGSILFGQLRLEGWSAKIPFYIFRCKEHGYQITYPSGHGKTLFCPKCIRENMGDKAG